MTIAFSLSDISRNPQKRRAWILYQLRLRGLTYTLIAQREGVSQQAVSAAASGSRSSHLQEILAGAIGVKVQDLFPEYYNDEGERIVRVREPQRDPKRQSGGKARRSNSEIRNLDSKKGEY
jgi:lambda repressor-like predicted transcriptional regulator